MAKMLQAMPLVELGFAAAPAADWNAATGQMILELLRNHPTLKTFQLHMSVNSKDFGSAIQLATESVRVCQLQSLELSIDPEPIGRELDSESFPDAAGLVQAFTSNVTLTDVSISDEMARNMRMYSPKIISSCTLRNKNFQEIMSSLIADIDDNSHLSTVSGSMIPLGLWPRILEVSHQRFPDASMLHNIISSLLSTHTVDLLCGGEE
jgi:hypothetical protein